MPKCRAVECHHEAETAWITDRMTDAGANEQVPVCGVHLVRLANRERVEFREGEPPPKSPSVWILRVLLPHGSERYYGDNWWGGDFTPAPGSAHRYESENAARYIGYSLKERGEIEDFTAEEVLNPRIKR